MNLHNLSRPKNFGSGSNKKLPLYQNWFLDGQLESFHVTRENSKIHTSVGTKVFAFVFSRNSLFVFAKDSLRKDGTFAKVFAKTKFSISRKCRGKNHSRADFAYYLKYWEGVVAAWKWCDFATNLIKVGTKFFDFVFFAKFNFRFCEKKLAESIRNFRENLISFRTRSATLRL
jgi:hypothetical protein